MKVRDVIDKCEELLQIASTREDLLDCFNVVEHDLALDYVPLYATHLCNARVVYYTEFKYAPWRIVECNCKFKLYPQYIESKDIITAIDYSYIPNNKELYDECSYKDEFLKCLAYGTVAEYLISKGFYEESALWNKTYKKEIEMLRL